eukprot:GFKZ01001003.1.p2 GENE.GFKZ01001003.1~~GFKZ01001003.1.p2  ORF type:complete len:115 (+),score=4.74 GFKZ01001003.1:130-474(+)
MLERVMWGGASGRCQVWRVPLAPEKEITEGREGILGNAGAEEVGKGAIGDFQIGGTVGEDSRRRRGWALGELRRVLSRDASRGVDGVLTTKEHWINSTGRELRSESCGSNRGIG